MIFNIICNKTMLKSFIHYALLYLDMARVRFHHAARANGIRWKNFFSFLLYLSLMINILKKHKCINNGLYWHRRARFRDWTFGRRSIIKAQAYYLKSTNSFPDKFWASTLSFCGKQIGSWCGTKFLAVHFRIRPMCLCLNYVLTRSKAMHAFCNKM